MANHPPRTPAPVPFFSINPQGKCLFSVNDDVPAEDALETASCFLASALDVARDSAHEANTSLGWTVVYMVEMARAIVDASVQALMEGRRHA